MAKRQNGEGSWGKKTIHGNLYYYYRSSNGHYTYGRTLNEVKDKLSKIPKDVTPNSKLTIREYVHQWLYGKKYQEIGIDYFGFEELPVEKHTFDF